MGFTWTYRGKTVTSWGKKHHLWMEIGDSTNLKHDGDLMGDS
jgi:hypothetical protein